MAEFLQKHRGDVMSTCLTEFNEEVYKKGLLEEGREEERCSVIKKLYTHNIPCEKIAEILEIPEEKIQQIIESIQESRLIAPAWKLVPHRRSFSIRKNQNKRVIKSPGFQPQYASQNFYHTRGYPPPVSEYWSFLRWHRCLCRTPRW